jgi:hypothetical protein
MCFSSEAKKLPQLVYMTNLKNTFKSTNLPTRVELHPIIEDFSRSMELVNNKVCYPLDWTEAQHTGVEPWLTFTSLADLRHCVREREYSDGNWKDHLMCVPAIEQVVIQFNWLKERGQGEDGKRSMCTAKMDTGVTVGKFVRTVRKMLTDHAVEDVKRIAHTLEIMGCGKCGSGNESDMCWMPEEETSSDEGDDTENENEEDQGDKEDSEDDHDKDDDDEQMGEA